MEGARAGRTAGLARAVLERARRRRAAGQAPASGAVSAAGQAPSGPEEDSERLSAAFTSIVNLMNQATRECEKYYSFTAACRCKEHEIKHICRYHGRQEIKVESSEEERTEASVAPSQAQTCQQHALVSCISDNNPGVLQSHLICAPATFPVLRKGVQQGVWQSLSQLCLASHTIFSEDSHSSRRKSFFFYYFSKSNTSPHQFQELLSHK
ncbi:A-kinase-interacting protein 1 isoform X1 [Rissa tridactyla]|uniref:A-kinase-interacting protein 1 isoform X1 n=2 Tax=Rissa tridactyla TaxID=75485 RepID=UPI0023BACAD8|nr:A-kinase-interacting protein 1 isoform X1 [Rissa tridactyla]